MATLRECIEAFNARMRVRDFEREPLRAVTVAMLRTRYWRADADELEGRGHRTRPGSQQFACRELAGTGEHLGIERVGRAIETGEVSR